MMDVCITARASPTLEIPSAHNGAVNTAAGILAESFDAGNLYIYIRRRDEAVDSDINTPRN